MTKSFWKHCLMGAITGVAANELIAAALSHALNLGYFMPCPASLPERVGGEMNAVWLQLALCALIGAGVAATLTILRRRQGRAGKRLLCAAAAFAGFLMPAVALTVGMLK